LLVVSMLALAPRAALAQREGDVVIVVDDGAPDDRARAWRERVLAALGVEPGSVAEWSAAAEPVDTVEPDRLAALGEIESLLVSAHRAATRLEEGDALRRLARAEATALRELTIPGMAAWYAEVELAIARTAAQAGLTGLADAALRRAASVDPTRTVRAAEARPELVERSEAAVRAAVTGPRGRFELRADAESARAFLDDHPLGALPRVVDAPVGPHVLRVEAPGCRSWARIVEVFEGERAPVEIRLAPTAARTHAEGADRAARGGHAGRLEAQLRALRSLAPPAVWMLWIGSGPADRAIAVRCTEGGCAAPRRLEPRSLSALDEEPLARWTASSLASALAWLDARPETASVAEPWWERWYVWVAAGVVMAAAAAAIGVAAQPRGPGPLQIEIDPGHLPTR
jgi:hypothetical protein